MKGNIQYTIRGVNYVLIQECFASKEAATKLSKKVKKFNCICQSAKVERMYFRPNIVYANILVPENKILEYNDEE